MRSTLWNRFVRTGVSLTLLAAVVGVSLASAEPAPGRPRRSRALNLFAAANLLLEVNRVQCNLSNTGEVCSAAGSPVGGGGFWPKGTVDQYIFNSGLQIAVVIQRNVPGFAWSGDTTGTFIFDPRGDQVSGDPLTNIFNSLDPADLAAWPNGAVVRDAAIYNPILLGRNQVSEGDSWVRYWEGNPALLGGRTHPAGILVEQRSLGWNFPSGNEDIIYFVFTFYNVSASSAAVYNNPTIPAAIQGEIASAGALFQRLNEAKFGIAIPDDGYVLEDVYAAFAMDADVAVFGDNYATAFLPFDIGSTYSGTFEPEVGWTFPADVFGPPFFPGAGFVGVKYLKSPESSPGVEVGLTLFSNTTNGPPFNDAQGVNLLYRRLSGFLGGGDLQCQPFTNPVVARQKRLCFLAQTKSDARFYQASGPFDLPPGESRTIVVGYIHAAPVIAVAPHVGGDVTPGVPATGDSIFLDAGAVRLIDSIAGWVSHIDADGDNVIEQSEVTTVTRSLLGKALVAQAVFDNKFLLPFSPDAPPFFLVPGDDQVTVVWQPSAAETNGDPFFAIAGQALDTLANPNPLYDANFRQFDVEGYRVYRGRTAAELELVAQFDYSGTTLRDFTGAVPYGDGDGDGLQECAPELGLQDDCPVTFGTTPPLTDFAETNLFGNVIQVPPGQRVELASGGTLILKADTAITGGGRGFPALQDTGVPFAFVDQGVRNSFTYVYAVTAFDVNSVKSGPSSLESPRITRSVTPRQAVSNEVPGTVSVRLFGDDGVELDPTQPANWTIGATTGRFTGSPPPTASLAAIFAPLVPQLIGPAAQATVIVDSVIGRTDEDGLCPTSNIQGICFEFFMSYVSGTDTTRTRTTPFWPIWTGFGEPIQETPTLIGTLIAADDTAAARYGIPPGGAQLNAAGQVTLREYIRFSAHENQGGRRLLGSLSPGGSRWFSGTDETLDHPTYSLRVGRVPGVDTIYAPLSHLDIDPTVAGVQGYSPPFVDGLTFGVNTNQQCAAYVVAATGRQADIQVTWGAGGTIASIRDGTHHVDVPFHAIPQAGYGFITDENGNGMIDWRDFDLMEGVAQSNAHLGFCAGADPGPGNRGFLVAQPAIGPVTTQGSNPAGTIAGFTATGTGFGLYLNGQQFIFQLTGGTPPAAGTVWTLRAYAGLVNATTNPGSTAPSGYTLAAVPGTPAIPGLRAVLSATARTELDVTRETLDNAHTVPDPYYVTNSLEQTLNSKVLKFVGLPAQAVIRIYSVSGVLVAVLVHNDPGLGAEATWNLRNRNNQFVASGVYFYHVETPQGKTKIGRFTIVNFAP